MKNAKLYRSQRDNLVEAAREYAKSEHFVQAKMLLERANKIFPISAIQIWAFRKILGYKFDELKFDEIPTKEIRLCTKPR